MLNHMFIINNAYTGTPNVIIEHKGFTISLAFDNGFNNKAGYLTRTEMLISKGDKTVTNHFFKHLIGKEDGNGETVRNITLDMLADVKTMIDSGKIDEEIAMAEEKRMPYITVYESVGGWKSVLMSWDEEMECHTPFQSGWFGYDDIDKAKDDARDWAEAEEIDLRV